ncbi:MAG: hypothetical protein R3202_10975 [Candidatus Competibacterales bacterium]|nr:hypothetical protein [Candidatus Competibacterales bacterium]
MTLLSAGILLTGAALAQSDDPVPMSSAPAVLSEDTPTINTAQTSEVTEGFERKESVEVDDGQLPPPAGPKVSGESPPSDPADAVHQGQLPPAAGPEVSDDTPPTGPVEVEPEAFKSKDSVSTN